MDRNFGGVIWTNHAISRMSQRGIKQGDAWATWSRPDESRHAKIPGAWIYYRTYGNDRIEVVAKKNGKGEWIILSIWSRPVFGQEIKSMKRESFWKHIVRQILGR